MTANEVELLLAQGAIPRESHVCSSRDGTWVPMEQCFPGRPKEALPQLLPPQPVVQTIKGVQNKPDEGHKEATAELASPVQIAVGIVALVVIIAVMILNWRSLMELPFILHIPLLNVPLVLGGWITRSICSLLKSHRGA